MIENLNIPPFLIFYITAILSYFLPKLSRQVLMIVTPVIGVYLTLRLPINLDLDIVFLNLQLTLLRTDELSRLFAILFNLGAFIAIIFSLHVQDRGQHFAGLVYAGSAIGAVFAGDLLTLFVFWELLALSSVFLILASKTDRAWAAAIRYLIIQVASGGLLLAGALLFYRQSGTLDFDYIGLNGIGGFLLFIAFGIKCAFPLLHTWLTDAYPEATPTGTVFLSAFTTKVAVYALARGFAGTEILIYIGAIMACFPIFYAVIENDLRRVLAYSMINQIGFMVVGIGIGTTLAINGAVAHAFNDVIFKGLLMMAMGSVLYVTNRINGSDLGGLYKTMPITTTLCIVGAASISAFPLFSGFVSKSMIMVEVLGEGHPVIWLALLFASAGVFHHAGIKIPFFAFFAHDNGLQGKEPPKNMLIAMTIGAILCVFIGVFPWILYDLLPYELDYSPFDSSHVIAQIQLLVFSAAAFAWLQVSGIYPPELRSTNLDVDWFFRKPLSTTINQINSYSRNLKNIFHKKQLLLWAGLKYQVLKHYGPNGTLAKSWPTGSMVLWVAILLGTSLVLYYL